MKKRLLVIFMFLGSLTVFAQTPTVWQYNFGTQAATFDIGGASYTSGGVAKSGTVTSSGTSEQNLPLPYTGQTVRLRAGSSMSGGFSLVTTGTTFGSGARLSMTATNAGNVNKFAIYNIGNESTERPATDLFSLSFNMKFSSGSVGTYQMIIGNGTTIASGGSSLNDTNRVMLATRWVLKESPTKHTFSYRDGVTQGSTEAVFNTISGSNFLNGGEYNVQVYCNNSAETKSYTKFGSTYEIAPNKFQIWVNLDRLLNGTEPDFNSGGLLPKTLINSILFVANGNTSGDAATFILDDVRYANYLVDPVTVVAVTLPVTLTEFKGKKSLNGIELTWKTSAEKNNSHFNVLHSAGGKTFKTIAKVAGNGNASHAQSYNFTDFNAPGGINYYQLQQVDYDGKATNSNIIAVNTGAYTSPLKVYALPGQQKLKASVYLDSGDLNDVHIYNLNGSQVFKATYLLNKGFNSLEIPFNAPENFYVLHVQSKGEKNSVKFYFSK
ncbi:MAG TPA: hypothetical protein VF273_00920 [Pelobium sp.]